MSDKYRGISLRSNPDEIASGGDFKKFETGNYEVAGLYDWFSLDDKDLPHFIPSTITDQMIARLHLKMVDGSQGPAWSATHAQIVGLVNAFGADVEGLPSEETTAFLLEAKERIDALKSPRVRTANVYNNWVQWVMGAHPPAILYTWRYTGVKSGDRKADPVAFTLMTRQSKHGGTYDVEIARLAFEILGDHRGQPTPFDGYRLEVEIQNPFDGSALLENGLRVPATKVSSTGKTPSKVDRFFDWVAAFCDEDVYEHRWQTDPTYSKLGVNELDNPLPVYDDYARRAKRRAIAKLQISEGGRAKLDLKDFVPEVPVVDRDVETKIAMQQPSALYELVVTIERLAGHKVFAPTPKDAQKINTDLIKPDGLNFMKDKVAPIYDELNLPKFDGLRLVNRLDEAQTNLLRETLVVLLEKAPFDVDDDVTKDAPEQAF